MEVSNWNATQGESVARWREGASFTTETLADALKISKSTLRRIERGVSRPTNANLAALRKLGWTPPVEGEAPQESAASLAASRIKELLDAGRPRAEVYDEAQKLLAARLSGMTNDEKRAWDVLLRSLSDGMREEGRVVPLHKHPEWMRWSEEILHALVAYPEALRAVQERFERLM